MYIYQATIKDLDGVVQLFNHYRQFYNQPSDVAGASTYLKERIENDESVIFIAKDKERYVGFIQLYPSFSSISMKKVWILNDLYVDHASRKKGVGGLLLDKVKAYSVETGAKSISLCTALDNVDAQSLYEKKGYKKDEHFYYYELLLHEQKLNK